MGFTKQTARRSTGGKAPRKESKVLNKNDDDDDLQIAIEESKTNTNSKRSKPNISKGGKGIGKGGKGGKGIGKGTDDEEFLSDEEVNHPNEETEKKSQLSDEKKQELLESFTLSDQSSAVEIVFSFDTTGSMSSVLGRVRGKLSETVKRLLKDIPNIRIGIIAHGDYCDSQYSYAISKVELTADVQKLVEFVNSVQSTGGGDSPECYELALREAKSFNWSPVASKALVVIGDDVPHPPSFTTEKISWFEEVDALSEKGVKIYGVRALNVNEDIPFYEELSSRTGAVSINFNDFNLIVNMFLAICYRESSSKQLEAFREEVKEKGKMSKEMDQIFDTLQQPNPEKRKVSLESNDHGKRNLPWYNHDLQSNVPPSYMYNADTGKWLAYTTVTPVSKPPSGPISAKKRKATA